MADPVLAPHRGRNALRGRDGGQALVEFALILPLLLLLVVGLFDLSIAVSQSNALSHAAREGTRYAIVRGVASDSPVGPGTATYTAPDQDTAVAAVVRQAAVGVPDVAVTATWPDGTAGRGDTVVVVATAPYTPVLSAALLGGALQITLRGGSEMAIQR